MAGDEAVMSDAVEAFGQDVDEEAADELIDIEGPGLMSYGVAAIVLVPEGDALAVVFDETGVGECDAVGVAAEVLEDGVGSGEGCLDMDVPVEVAQGSEVGGEGLFIGERLMVSEEAETRVGLVEMIEHQGSEASGEHFMGQQVSGAAGDPA